MLKRQRPATPPPSSLGDPPSFLPNVCPIRPLPSLHTADPFQPRPKRQRTQPPPLDGAVRGWLKPESPGAHWESDGEEDWIEDPYSLSASPLPPSTAASQYKDANSLLHELHVLNQHRLLFAHPPRDRPLNHSPTVPVPTAHVHAQDPSVGQRPTTWAHTLPYHLASTQFTRDEPAQAKGLVEEVHCVRQRYEGTNKLLGSLFLSRRREVEETTSTVDLGSIS